MNELIPIEQKQVMFYEDEVTAVRMADGSVYVPIRPLCDYLGLDWSGQLQRLHRDPVLSEALSGVVITPTPLEDNKFANPQEMMCLPLDYLNGWLFGVNANRVKPEVREQVIRYQRECYKVLADAFQSTAIVANAPSTLVQVREMGLAIVRMAEEQMAFERRLGATEDEVRVITERLTSVEEKLSPTAMVTEEQASQISQAVKAVALALGKKTKKNEFGAIYGELYRRYSLTSYKMMPSDKFDDAMKFLTEWHRALVNDSDDIPF